MLISKIPECVAIEKELLSALLLNSNTFPDIKEQLTPEDFFNPSHALVFEAISELYNKNRNYNLTLIVDYLKSKDYLSRIGGEVFLIELQDTLVQDKDLTSYVTTIRDKRYAREALTIVGRYIQAAQENDTEKMKKLASDIFDTTFKTVPVSYKIFKDIARETMLNILKETDDGFSTGFQSLDELTNKLRKSTLVTIAAQTSVGKTAFALKLALNLADQGIGTLFISLEMTMDTIVMRIISQKTLIPFSVLSQMNIKSPNLQEVISKAQTVFNNIPLFLVQRTVSIIDIENQIRLSKKNHHVKVVFIDYIQLIRCAKNTENRNLEITYITRALANLAIELDICIVILSQLSRGVSNRVDKRPMLSDLRDSGAIEQDSDIVIFLYRDSIYNKDCIDHDEVEVSVAKNRAGARDKILFFIFDGPTMSFKEKTFMKEMYEQSGNSIRIKDYLQSRDNDL